MEKAFKTIRRRAWRSSLANKTIADIILDGLVKLQTNINITVAKLDAADPMALPVDFADNAIGQIADWDFGGAGYGTGAPVSGHGQKKSLYWGLLHALYSAELTKEMMDAMEELQVAHDALCTKLDAEAGALASVDFEDTIGVQVTNPKMPIEGRAKASLRTWLVSSMSSKQLADEWIKAIRDCQITLNAALAKLDAGTITGEMPAAISVLKPEEKL